MAKSGWSNIPDMITRDRANEIIRENVKPSKLTESIPLENALGAVLADDVYTDIDTPPFTRVTMDGYAVISSDRMEKREVIEYAPAGVLPKITVTPGKVSRVMTGAPLPEGADAVIQVENSGGFVEVGDIATILASVDSGANVSKQGEDINKGEKILDKNLLITTTIMTALAGAGLDPVTVVKKPTVALLCTGDELVDPGQTPGPGQIRNSNAYTMIAQMKELGIDPVNLGVARDDINDLVNKLEAGSQYDFLLVSGGVSAGDKDHVPPTLEKLGYRTKFHKVKIKPGKPLLFCVKDGGGYAFGLPGNPVSTFVSIELFIKPAIKRFMGLPFEDTLTVKAVLAGDYKRKSGEREEFVPVSLEFVGDRYRSTLLRYHGSAHALALTKANALMRAPVGVTFIGKGSLVDARFF